MSAWLAACASDASQQSLPPEKADGRYALISFSLNTKKDGTSRSDTLPVYYRVFEKDRKLAICGYYLVQSSSCERDLNRQLLDNSEVLVNDKSVGSGRFFNAVPGTLNFDLASRSFSYQPQSAPEGGCVLTEVPWDDSFARTPRLALRGGRAFVTCPIF